MRKNIVNPISARYLFSIPKRVIQSRWSAIIIIVNVAVVMTMGSERRRKARICFGISFSPKKVIASSRSHSYERFLFFSLPKESD